MKTLLLLSGLLSLLSISAFGQTRANYSGEWILDKDKSNTGIFLKDLISMVMQVSQTGDEIIVTTTTQFPPPSPPPVHPPSGTNGPSFGLYDIKRGYVGDGTYRYSLDGEERVVEDQGLNPNMTVKIRAFFENGLLKLQSIRTARRTGVELTFKALETWELTEGGKSLKVTRDGEFNNTIQKIEMLFNKK